MIHDIHKEKYFEDDIESSLTTNGWNKGINKDYSSQLALYPVDVMAWLKIHQPKDYAKLVAEQSSEEHANNLILQRLADTLNKYGSLYVLKNGFKASNVKFNMCVFKPPYNLNKEDLKQYDELILRVVRQVHYSPYRPAESIDVVLFINGIPITTLELKTDFTQSIDDAINQFKTDRPPLDPKTKQKEPLLTFKRCVVHFAVSTDEVYMTTQLNGEKTVFLPFNLGVDGGAGNPDNPVGYKTAYLWQQILVKDKWLEILNRYVYEVDKKVIFPRFHQLDVVNKLCEDIKLNNVGKRYLIQHSAGSGKTNSITWLATRLRELHDYDDNRMFECVFVVTDRKVLDGQLQKNLNQFVKTSGVVRWIADDNGSKSGQLLEILQNREQSIVVVTIQSFAFLLNKIQDTDFSSRNFAIIIDEAHSSTSGGAAASLKKTVSMHEDPEEYSLDDLVAQEMEKHKFPKNASFFAFTATPKEKTLELFGSRNIDGLPIPFHVYSMRQAIQEGFILDVLNNYTSYSTAFRIAKTNGSDDIETLDEQSARKTILKWVDLHPDNVGQKVAIIVEHYRKKVRYLLGGEAKAMIVTSSRLKAKRFKEAIDDYIARNQYDLKTLVAFSGSLTDPDKDGDKEFDENGLNPVLKGRDLSSALTAEDGNKFTDWHCLVVANKFQTGFDEPLLCGMYVDKKLSGVAAVQTLSRLNRTCTLNKDGQIHVKNKTYILDFVNDPADIKKSFSLYYQDAEIEDVTDPNLIDDCQIKLDEFTLLTGEHVYYQDDVENVIQANYISNKPDQIMVALAPSIKRFSAVQTKLKSDYQSLVNKKTFLKDAFEIDKIQQRLNEIKVKLFEMKDFINQCGRYRRMYDFMSQIFDYQDTELHKRYVFYGYLTRLLKSEIPIENEKQILEQIKLIKVQVKDEGTTSISIDDKLKLRPIQQVISASVQDPSRAILDEIIALINETYGAEIKQSDIVAFVNNAAAKMVDNEKIQERVQNNTPADLMVSPLVSDIYEGVIFENSSNNQIINNHALEQEDSILGRKIKGLVLSKIYELFDEMKFPGNNNR
ncbi:MAG: DEAD/DEAH box helicase family protein [Burkholderiales bacterium]|nr:DEAD/DEAH box helicase family protein [Burkholderiales bacterium]